MTGTCAICGHKLTPSGYCPTCDFDDVEEIDDEDELEDDELNDDDIHELGVDTDSFAFDEEDEE